MVESRHLIPRALKGLRSLHIGDLAVVDATEYAMALPLALSSLQEAATPRRLSGALSASALNSASAYIAEACDYFRLQRQYLKFGKLIRRLAYVPIPDRLSPDIVRVVRRLYPKRW